MALDETDLHVHNVLTSFNLNSTESETVVQIIHDLCQNIQVIALYLYGSCARKEQKPYSDIDIAVITSTPYPERCIRECIGSYSSKKIDVQVFSDLPLPARMQVLEEGIPLYVRNRESLRNIIKSVSFSYMDLEPMRNRLKHRILGI